MATRKAKQYLAGKPHPFKLYSQANANTVKLTSTHPHMHMNTHGHACTHARTHTLLQSNRCRSIACRLSEVKVISGWLIYQRCSFCTGLTSYTWQGEKNSKCFITYSALIPIYCYPVLYTTNRLNACTCMSYIVCTQLCSFHYTTFTKNNTDTQHPSATKISEHILYELTRINPHVQQHSTTWTQQSEVCYLIAHVFMYKSSSHCKQSGEEKPWKAHPSECSS